MGQLPVWSLTDQNGKDFGSEELQGQPFIASFFFTSCTTICPRIMGGMRALQDRFVLHDMPVRLISITVDAENDTPERLLEKATAYGVDGARWRLLTGSEAELRKVIVDGFQTYMGERAKNAEGVFDIGHGARLVLVDGNGGVRGHYATTEEGRDEIFWRVKHVLAAVP